MLQSPQAQVTLGPFDPNTCQFLIAALKKLPMEQVEGLVVQIANSANAQIKEFEAAQLRAATAPKLVEGTDD